MSNFEFGYIDQEGNFVNLSYIGSVSIIPDNGSVNKLTTSVYGYYDYIATDCMAHRLTVTNPETIKPTNKTITNMFKHIKDYNVYGKTTVVFFDDGTKSTVTCHEDDNFDVEQGITMCVIRRMFNDDYKKDVRKTIKAQKTKEKNLQKREAANKEARLREERRKKRARENKLKMKARYEARLAAAIEEEKKKLQK